MRLALLLAAFFALFVATPAAAHDGVEHEGVLTHRDTRDELSEIHLAATAHAAAAPDALPYTWCGDELPSDDTVHAAQAPNAPRFKLVYVHAADRPDRFAAWADALQRSEEHTSELQSPYGISSAV